MARWIEYYKTHDGKIMPALGSEGFQPVDGRFGLARCHEEARDRARRLANVQKYTHYRIRQGRMPSSSVTIGGLIKL